MLPVILLWTLCLLIGFQILPYIVIPIVLWIMKFFCGRSKDEQERWIELSKFKEELKTIHMVDNFAKYAKLERKIKSLESRLYERKAGRETKLGVAKYVVKIVLKLIEGLVALGNVYSSCDEYINILPHFLLYLLPEFLQYQVLVSPPAWFFLPIWILVCRIVVVKTFSLVTEMLPSE